MEATAFRAEESTTFSTLTGLQVPTMIFSFGCGAIAQEVMIMIVTAMAQMAMILFLFIFINLVFKR
jgi:hypothetical protein